jgi:hypothetical protein
MLNSLRPIAFDDYSFAAIIQGATQVRVEGLIVIGPYFDPYGRRLGGHVFGGSEITVLGFPNVFFRALEERF